MIEERRKLSLHDFSGRGNDIDLEVNWNKKVKGNKFLKLSIDGKESVVKHEHLWTILFMLSEQDKQADMLPTYIQTVKNYSTVVSIKSRSDIRKGDVFTLPLTVSVNSEGKMSIKP